MQRFINSLIPFIFIGVALVAFGFGVFILAYLFLFGALLGLILFCLNYIKNKFLSKKKLPVRKTKTGRIIDSDDWKVM